MLRKLIFVCAVLLANAIPAAAEDNPCKGIDHDGVWQASKPVKIPMIPFCMIKYTCGPREQIMYDASCKMSADSENVKGACSAGTGQVDDCNSCLAAAPSRTCHWKFVKK
jgi:hypothetical protein